MTDAKATRKRDSAAVGRYMLSPRSYESLRAEMRAFPRRSASGRVDYHVAISKRGAGVAGRWYHRLHLL